METEELIRNILLFIQKERTLEQVCLEFGLHEYEVFDLIYQARESGNNIVYRKEQDDIYMINQGDIEFRDKNTYNFETNDANEFKFIAVSDTLFGSKSQQLSILNDIYQKGYEMGYDNVILCGNISAGIYPITDRYKETLFLDDTYEQIEYISKFFPKIEGMTTYFITGKNDDKHIKKYKVDIGRRIADKRSDMVYLGPKSCDLLIDKVRVQLLSSQLAKTYTSSYRTQQQIDSYRSEDKPDILIMGGLLQMEKYYYRNVHCLSVPSVCATTKEMNDKRYANTVGAWYVTVRTNEKGLLDSFTAFNSPYYTTDKNDYTKAKKLDIKDNPKKLVLIKGEELNG